MHSNNRYAIALHTSTPQLGIAVNNYAGDSRSQIWDLGRGLASKLHLHLAEILYPQTWQDLKFIAVAKGPGGFTGTRVGVVTARTIAQQLDIPLYGVSNLAAVAAAQQTQSPKGLASRHDRLLAVQMDARREQLFVGIYQRQGQGLQTYLADTLMEPSVWQQTLADLQLPYELIIASAEIAHTVNNVLDLAHKQWQEGEKPHWSQVVPYYGQDPVSR